MFNGESPYISLNEVLYFGQVDGGDLVLQNMNQGNWLDMSSVVYTTASGYVVSVRWMTLLTSKRRGTESFSHRRDSRRCREFPANPCHSWLTHQIGGLAGLAVLALAFWWFCWRRRQGDK
jgi:hypothetical protein